MTDDVERFGADTASHRLAADDSAFLVGEDDELERMPRGDAVLTQQLRHLDGAQHAHVAVVIAALRDGVDVRAGHDHGQRRIGAGTASDDVACRVDPHFEPGTPHQRRDVFASGDIRVAERHAADAARRIGAEASERVDALLQALRVRPRAGVAGLGARRRGGGRQRRVGDRGAAATAAARTSNLKIIVHHRGNAGTQARRGRTLEPLIGHPNQFHPSVRVVMKAHTRA